ncbi:MAG: CspA family cold shock protein [Alphaproteobacteria bacterium]|nr:CspA family cold shock protein [Alphaproteobacteria bacterium]
MTSIKSHPVMTNREKCKQGKVRWFSERLGYGFIDVEDNEVFIHRSTLTQFGATRLLSDDTVLVTITTSSRGLIVETLLGIERMPVDESLIASKPSENEHPAFVKFFNEVRGYRFIEVEGYDQDIFVHSRVIEQNGLSTIYDNQRLLVTVELGEKGYQIRTIRLLVSDDEDDQSEAPDNQPESPDESQSDSASGKDTSPANRSKSAKAKPDDVIPDHEMPQAKG